MQTLSHGVLKPENGDTGDVFFPALALLAQLFNDHTHDGIDAEPLTAQSIQGYKQTPSITWSSVGDGSGSYSTIVSLPSAFVTAGHTLDTVSIQFKSAAGKILYLSMTQESPTSFKVYSNDNTLSFVVVYTS